MICNKCGAPIPGGMTVCPYCGASTTAAPRQDPMEETSFAEVDEHEFPAEDAEATEFVQGGEMPAAQPAAQEEETAFAQPGADFAVPTRSAHKTPAGPKAAKSGKRKNGQKKQKKAQKKAARSKTEGPNQALRVLLLAVLAVLIVLLILR